MMQRSTQRVLTGLGALLLGACALGAAAPAHAAETAPTGLHVEIGSTVPVYNTPRENTAVMTQLFAGEEVQAFCAFHNAGKQWVKVQRSGDFGFIDSAAVRGGVNDLPSTCPNEIESVDVPAPGANFATVTWGARLEGFTCPDSYPFLDARVAGYSKFLFDDALGFKGTMPGISIERTFGVGVDFGELVWRTNPADGKSYIGGYGDGSISNHDLGPGTAKITATCTNNAAYAKDTKPGL